MRNGNDTKLDAVQTDMSSYRTYEEWKQQSIETFGYVEPVLTVPMRNGNINLQF